MSRQGRHGEWKFGEICTTPGADVGAVVNKASDDQHGWDLLVELEPPFSKSLPADLQTRVVQSAVQVKTTRSTSSAARLKLSNAVKAAKSPLPCFVFLLRYTDANAEPEVFGRHVWLAEIRRWLQRARETEVSGETDIRKLQVAMTFRAQDKIETSPADWMWSQIEAFGQGYAAEKSEIVRTVGYEECSAVGTFNIGPLSSAGEIVAHEIGLSDDLPVSSAIIHDVRFGIKSRNPLMPTGPGRLSIQSDGKPVSIELINKNNESITIPGQAWVPSVVSVGHPEFRLRVKAGFIDVSLPSGKSDIRTNFTLSYNQRQPLVQQVGFLSLASWSSEGPVSLAVSTDLGKVLEFTSRDFCGHAPWVPEMAFVGHHLLKILGEKRGAELEVSIAELFEPMKSLHVAAVLTSGRNIRVEGQFEEALDPFSKVIGYAYGRICDWSVGALYEFASSHSTLDNGKDRFELHQPKILKRFVSKKALEAMKDDVVHEFNQFKENQVRADSEVL